jgi:hypothetical protein
MARPGEGQNPIRHIAGFGRALDEEELLTHLGMVAEGSIGEAEAMELALGIGTDPPAGTPEVANRTAGVITCRRRA